MPRPNGEAELVVRRGVFGRADDARVFPDERLERMNILRDVLADLAAKTSSASSSSMSVNPRAAPVGCPLCFDLFTHDQKKG